MILMKRLIMLLIFLLLVVNIGAQEGTVPEEDPGLTPDSFLWGLDRAIEQISLLLTLDSGKKASKRLDIARERLLEVKAMIEENKVEAAAKAQRHHDNALLKVKEEVKEFEAGVSQDKIETILKLESKIDNHEENAERIVNELNVKIKIEGELTEEQQKLLDTFLESVKGHASDLEVEIKEKKDRIKLRLREDGKTEEEIKIELERVAEEGGIKHKERAAEAIREAEDELAEILEEGEKDIPAAVLERFNSLIAEANLVFEVGNFAEARRLAKRAEHLLDIDEEEREIEIEIEDGIAKVKIKVGDHRFRFALHTDNIDEVINEIMKRTGLSEEEIMKIMEVKIDEDHEEGLERAFELRVEHVEREIEKSKRNLEEDEHSKELESQLEEAEMLLDRAEDLIENGHFEEAREIILKALKLAVSVRGEHDEDNGDKKERLEEKRRRLKDVKKIREKLTDRREMDEDEIEADDEEDRIDERKDEALKRVETELGDEISEEVKLDG